MTELILKKDEINFIDATGKKVTIQNTMPTYDDVLYVSTHGDPDKVWLEVKSMGKAYFDEKLYFKHNRKQTWAFPVKD